MCRHPTCANGICRRVKKKTPRQPIKKVAKNRPKIDREYAALSKKIRAERPWCEIRSPVCTGKAQGLHHTKGQGIYLLDETTLLSACNACNGWVEAHPEEARKIGAVGKRNYEVKKNKF